MVNCDHASILPQTSDGRTDAQVILYSIQC